MAGTSRSFFLFLLLICTSNVLIAQNKKYIVYFTDKNNNLYTLSNPSAYLSLKSIQRRLDQNINITTSDLPVTPDYLDSLVAKGAQVLYSLKWLNAAIVSADSLEMVDINTLPFVKNNKSVARKMTAKEYCNTESIEKKESSQSSPDYGISFDQVNMLEADEMHNDGFHGEGMLVALLDAGFKNASSVSFLNHLYSNSKIISTYDFVDNESDVYDDDQHGLEVLSSIGAYLPGSLIGTAYRASFVLLRTEDAFTETEIEESNWARGAEYADSIGVDIISSSLGYTTFDTNSVDHTHQDLDGNTTIAAIAADQAASKGILVLCSAGNEGHNSWHKISTPADGDSVLAIGAVDYNMQYVDFSSVGPSADGRIKPDLAAMGSVVILGSPSGGITTASGTSFSCPLTAGLAAGLWQSFPKLNNMQIAEALKKSATQYANPDYYLGYGIPRYTKAKEYINFRYYDGEIDLKVYPNPIQEGILFFTASGQYFNEKVKVKMFDITGKQVGEDEVLINNVANEIKISVTDFPKGMYLLQFYFSDKIKKLKFVKH
jgi:serine protease AprX